MGKNSGASGATTGIRVKQIVLRTVDGAEILRRVAEHGVTVLCAAPAVVSAVLAAGENWEGEIPGRGRVRIIVASAPPPTETIERVQSELGWEFIQIYGLSVEFRTELARTATGKLQKFKLGDQYWADHDRPVH